MQEDNSPVGPLKLQLPDLMNSSEKERTTVLVEGGEEEQQASADLSRDASQHAGSDSAPVSDSKGVATQLCSLEMDCVVHGSLLFS